MANPKLDELIERVKAATGPDRYADCHLWVIAKVGDARMVVCDSGTKDFVWERGIDGLWVRGVVKFRDVPKYTSSIDEGDEGDTTAYNLPSMPLALCLAFLQALSGDPS